MGYTGVTTTMEHPYTDTSMVDLQRIDIALSWLLERFYHTLKKRSTMMEALPQGYSLQVYATRMAQLTPPR